MAIYENYPIAKWQVGSSSQIAFPVKSISESGGNRIIPRERPYRDGAKLDDTGRKERRWSFTVIFENTIEESNLTSINGNTLLYPNILNKIIESFDNHNTGDLVVPTTGSVRARAESYTRDEDSELRDCAILKIEFVEDNEDSIRATSFNIPTANATSRKLAETTTFDTQSGGMWSDSLDGLEESAGNLEDFSNQFSDTADDINHTGDRVVSLSKRSKALFTKPWQDGRNLLNDPENSSAQRDLNAHEDIAARAKNDARKGKPRIIIVVSTENQTLMSIASYFSQDFSDLLAINAELPDPTYIPKGTYVNVYYG